MKPQAGRELGVLSAGADIRDSGGICSLDAGLGNASLRIIAASSARTHEPWIETQSLSKRLDSQEPAPPGPTQTDLGYRRISGVPGYSFSSFFFFFFPLHIHYLRWGLDLEASPML